MPQTLTNQTREGRARFCSEELQLLLSAGYANRSPKQVLPSFPPKTSIVLLAAFASEAHYPVIYPPGSTRLEVVLVQAKTFSYDNQPLPELSQNPFKLT